MKDVATKCCEKNFLIKSMANLWTDWHRGTHELPLRLKHKWKDNIKTNLIEIGRKGLN
jgi:hypothetical protein